MLYALAFNPYSAYPYCDTSEPQVSGELTLVDAEAAVAAAVRTAQEAYERGLRDGQHVFLKTRPCRNWDGTPGSCTYGDACHFAHGAAGGREARFGVQRAPWHEGARCALLPESLYEDTALGELALAEQVCQELASLNVDAWPSLGSKRVLAVTPVEEAPAEEPRGCRPRPTGCSRCLCPCRPPGGCGRRRASAAG